MKKKPGEKFHRLFLRTIVLSLLSISFFFIFPGKAVADNYFGSQFARALLGKIFESYHFCVSRRLALDWSDDLNAAVQKLVSERGSPFKSLDPSVISSIRDRFRTPVEAEAFIKELGALPPGWQRVLRGYRSLRARNVIADESVLSSNLLRWARGEEGAIHHQLYYCDEIGTELRALRKERDCESLLNIFGEIERGFQVSPSNANTTLSAILDSQKKRLALEIERLQLQSRGAGAEKIHVRLRRVEALIERFSTLCRENHRFVAVEALPVEMVDDYWLAQLRYGNSLLRKTAWSALVQSDGLGRGIIHRDLLKELLSSSEPDFRKFALQTLAMSPPLPAHICLALDAMLAKMNRYLPAEKAFKEILDTIALLVREGHEIALGRLLKDPLLSPREKIPALRALGWIDSNCAFEILSDVSKNESSRRALNDIELFNAFIEELSSLKGLTTAGILQLRPLVASFLEGEARGEFRRIVMRGFGRVVQSERTEAANSYLIYLFLKEKDPLVRAEALQAIAGLARLDDTVQLSIYREIVKSLTLYPELRFASALFMRRQKYEPELGEALLLEMLEGGNPTISILRLSEESQISLLEELRTVVFDLARYKKSLLKVIQKGGEGVRSEALAVLMKGGDREAEGALLRLFDHVSVEVKRKIAGDLIAYSLEKETLKNILKKIFSLFDDSGLQMAWLETFSLEKMPLQRFAYLKGDRETIAVLKHFQEVYRHDFQHYTLSDTGIRQIVERLLNEL